MKAIPDQGGLMVVLIPQSSLDPIRQKLERERKAIPSSSDPRWTLAPNHRISTTEVKVNAFIEGEEMQLGEFVKLKLGATIEPRLKRYQALTFW